MFIVNFGNLRLFYCPTDFLIIILLLRESLVRPLFKLLEKSMSKEWVKIDSSVEETSVQPPQDVRETTPASISSIQQTLLLILKDIFDSLNMNPLKVC